MSDIFDSLKHMQWMIFRDCGSFGTHSIDCLNLEGEWFCHTKCMFYKSNRDYWRRVIEDQNETDDS